VPTSAPDFFTTDTPTAVLVRQVLGAVSQFEKANLVAKLRAARHQHRRQLILDSRSLPAPRDVAAA
jgi:DNA invertase Pin-like site-specific DNA recombinase